MRFACVLLSAGLCFVLAACAQPKETKPNTAAIEAAIRYYDTGSELGFAAAAETLMDLGYVITVSDRRAGLLCGQTRVSASHGHAYSQYISMQVRELGSPKIAVRTHPLMSTEFWTSYERRLLMGQPAAGVIK